MYTFYIDVWTTDLWVITAQIIKMNLQKNGDQQK